MPEFVRFKNAIMNVTRRQLVLGGAATTLTAWTPVSTKRWLIVWLAGGIAKGPAGTFPAHFLEGMREFGYLEGRDFDLVYRFAEAHLDRLPGLAEEVVQLKPDIILAAAIDAVVAAHNATKIIPIVGSLVDPVNLGLIASEARPGGNVTGIEPYLPGLSGKQMELACEIVPGATRIGMITNLRDPKGPPQWEELKHATKDMEIAFVVADVDTAEKIDDAFQTFASKRVDVVLVAQSTLLLNHGRRIAELALEKRLPTVFGYRENVVAGGLISYGIDLRGIYHRAAYFVDRVLRGTPPGYLPVEFPTKTTLALNLKTAKAMGLKISDSIMMRVDELIE